MQGFIAGALGIIAAIIFLARAQNSELREVVSALRRLTWKARPIAPQEKE